MKFGCHCDLDLGMLPDGCVLDYGKPSDCVYARNLDKRENCKYWLPYGNTTGGVTIEALEARVAELEQGIQAALNLFHDDTIDGPETLEEMAVILCTLKPK